MDAKEKLDMLYKFIIAYRENTEALVKLCENMNDEEGVNYSVRVCVLKDIERLIRNDDYLIKQYKVFFKEVENDNL